MKLDVWLRDPRNRLDIVAGLIDGILNALILASAKLVTQGGLTLLLVGKVGVITACTTSFVFFVAHYAQLRSELVRAARELNLMSHGHLVTTQLGKQILREALSGAVVASAFGVIGSAIPLAVGLVVPELPFLGLALAVALLGILGWLLALGVFGSPALWAINLMLGGIVVTVIGVKLDILS
jgi:hypothetical protein